MSDDQARLETRRPLVGEVIVVPLPPGKLAREALVLLDEHGEVRAYENICQHIPIPLDAGAREFLDDDGELVCNTHGAVYRRSDGECVSGPCMGRQLVSLRVKAIDADRVAVEPREL